MQALTLEKKRFANLLVLRKFAADNQLRGAAQSDATLSIHPSGAPLNQSLSPAAAADEPSTDDAQRVVHALDHLGPFNAAGLMPQPVSVTAKISSNQTTANDNGLECSSGNGHGGARADVAALGDADIATAPPRAFGPAEYASSGSLHSRVGRGGQSLGLAAGSIATRRSMPGRRGQTRSISYMSPIMEDEMRPT